MKKKGFTLIELLAVLVVLAIVALITIPIVLGVINRARIKSEEASVRGYADTLEKSYSEWLVDHPNSNFNDFDYSNIEYKGNRVICDDVDYNGGFLTLQLCSVNGSRDRLYKYENGSVVKQTEYSEYEVGDVITLLGFNYYVIKDSNKYQDYVIALKRTPLSYDDIVTYGTGYINKDTSGYSHSQPYGVPFKSSTYGDVNVQYGGVAYYSDNNCNGNIMSDCKINYDQSDIKGIIDGWVDAYFKHDELKQIDNYKARLIEFSELKELGYVEQYNGSSVYYPENDNVPSWIYDTPNYFYWINGYTNGTTEQGYINAGGTIGQISEAYPRGAVRPVININKKAIE